MFILALSTPEQKFRQREREQQRERKKEREGDMWREGKGEEEFTVECSWSV